ncbi:MAG TPA: hypothetical protein VMQ44_00430 [Candidatus Saccharimonadales bacterium]|nr:hypothetical protein [Candidatus Saccharimonadales bacterium]
MREKENRGLLWYGIAFFGLMALVCFLYLDQNRPTQTTATGPSGNTTFNFFQNLF